MSNNKLLFTVVLVFAFSTLCCNCAVTHNVRSLSASPTPQPQPEPTWWLYNRLDHYISNERLDLFQSIPFDVSLATTSDIFAATIPFTFNAVDTFNFELQKRADDLYVTSKFEVLLSGKGTPEQVVLQDRIAAVLRQVVSFKIHNNGGRLVFSSKGETISFDKLVNPTGSAASAATATFGAQASAAGSGSPTFFDYSGGSGQKTLYVVPDTYFDYGKKQLYSGSSFPMILDAKPVGGGLVRLTFKAINVVAYEITYNNANGWVTNVKPFGHTQYVGKPEQMAAETKVKNIIASCEQIVFHKSGGIQFIADKGQKHIDFDLISRPSGTPPTTATTTPPPVKDRREVVAETYFQNGRFQPLFTGPSFPITVHTLVYGGGFVKVMLTGINEFNYDIKYNNADGWVSNVQFTGQTQYAVTPDQNSTEAKLRNIIANTQQIAFEKDGRIQFITDNGSTRISFDPFSPPQRQTHQHQPRQHDTMKSGLATPTHFATSAHPAVENRFIEEDRYVVPETYFQNGYFQPLYTGPPFPISVHTQLLLGGFIKVSLKAINVYNYDIKYNIADGWVSNVLPTGQTQYAVTPDQKSTEAKLRNIIANTQQLAFEKDGRLQFITDNGSSRISFDPFQETAQAAVGFVVANSYVQNGQLQSLYMGAPFPITVTTVRDRGASLTVTLKAVNTIKYGIQYNTADGWVNSITLLSETNLPITHDRKVAEEKVKNIIAKCEQIVFEKDGLIQFIAHGGASKIAFKF